MINLRTWEIFVVAGAVSLLLGACGDSGFEPGTVGSEPPAESSTTDPGTTTPEVTLPQNPSSESAVELAVTDLAARLNVDASAIDFIKAEAGYWNDGSLGCPEDYKAYIQMLVQGHRIILRHGDILYSYHQGGSEKPFYCEFPRGDAFTVDKSLPQISVPPPID